MQIIYEPFKSRPLSDFHEELRFEFIDLPSQAFDYYLLRTAISMAKDGHVIRRRAIIPAQHGITRYRLNSPDGMALCGILDIRSHHDCSCLQYAVPRSFVAPEGAYACKRDIACFDDQDCVLHIHPSHCHGIYYVSLAVTPVMDACDLPEEFYSDLLPTLLLGTRAMLLMITGRPWTNLNLGNALYKQFQDAVHCDSIEVATHMMRGGIKMQFGRAL